MSEVLARDSVISIGNPVLHLTPKSFVQLHYISDRRVINLYKGNHPLMILNESDIYVNFSCQFRSLKEDVAKFIERQILTEVNRILSTSNFKISKGDLVPGLENLEVRYIRVSQKPKIKGLAIDPHAMTHSDWFKPR